MQEPKGQPRRQQTEPSPLGLLGLHSQHTQPKSRSFSAHFRPSLTAPFSKQAPLVGVHMGLWPVIAGGKSAAFMEGGQVQVLGSFGDTASHLPDCCSLHALVSDAEGPYLNRPLLSGSPRTNPRRPVCSTVQYRDTTVVCPLASEPTEPLLGTHQAGHKLEIPGSRCHNPLSTKQKLAIKCTKPASIYQTAKH